MDIISKKVQQIKIIDLMDLAVWLERTMGPSFVTPEEYVEKGFEEAIKNDTLLAGFREHPHYKDCFPVKGLLFLRYYAMYVMENMQDYPGTHKVDLNSWIDMWNADLVARSNSWRAEMAEQFRQLRIQTAMLPKTPSVREAHDRAVSHLTRQYEAGPADLMEIKHRFDDRLNRLLADFKYSIQLFVGDNPWVIHRVRFRGQDIILEKMEDYRILEWMILHKNNALDVARTKYTKDKEAK